MRLGQPRLVRILAVALSFGFLVGQVAGPVSSVRADTISDRIAAARQHQKDLQRSIEQQRQLLQGLNDDEALAKAALSSTSDQLDSLNANQADVRQQVQAATDALQRVQARRVTLQAQLRQQDYTLSLLEGQIEQGSEDLEAQREALGARLADAYRSQQTTLLEQVLSSSSFTDVLSQASAYLSLGQQDANMAASITDDQASLDSLRRLTVATHFRTDQLRQDAETSATDLIAQQASLAQVQKKLNALTAQTRAVQDQQAAAWNRINDNQDKVNAALAKQLRDQAAFQQKIAAMVAWAQKRAAQHERKHPLPPPPPRTGHGGGGNGTMIWPAKGGVSQEFGCTGFSWEPPLGNCPHFHQGIDIFNAEGTPIHAAKAGVIASVGWGLGGEFLVVIGHSGGMQTWYAHMEPRYVVRVGEYVQQGQLVGYMGNTGHSTGTHLHFAVYLDNGKTPVNPRNYF